MFAYLKHNNESIHNTSNIEMNSSDEYLSLTTHTKGIWYFEYSHIEGNASYVIGYQSSLTGNIATNPNYNFPKLYAYTVGNISLNDSPKTDYYRNELNVTVDYNEHIGVGIDIDNKNVFYLYHNILTSFKYDSTDNEWSVIVREPHVDDVRDKVNVFFERKDFDYDPPFNALPWYSHIQITCVYKNYNHIHSLFLISLTISLLK